MSRRRDGLLLRGSTWWLDFRHQGQRHQVRIGKNISRTVAGELATLERGKILRGEAGIGGRKRKDILFDDATKLFLEWASSNKKPKTLTVYTGEATRLMAVFKGKRLSEIHTNREIPAVSNYGRCQGCS